MAPEPESIQQPQQKKTFGFTTIERHPTGGVAIRWEQVAEADEEPTPDEVLWNKNVFQVGEWLGKIPIGDGLREEFFNLDWVKVRISILLFVDIA